MSLFEKNIEAIDECIIGFKNRCESITDVDISSIEVVPGKENIPIIRIETEPGKKVLLNSIYRCNDEISQWIEKIDTERKYVYILFGLSNGEQIRKLIQKMHTDSRIIIYESCKELFYKAMSEIDFTDIFESKKCLIVVEGINELNFESCFGALVTWSNREIVKQIVSIKYDVLFLEGYKRFVTMIRDAQEKLVINRNTNIYFSKFIPEAIMWNLNYLYESYSLADFNNILPEDCLGIVVSSGPSLMKNIKFLKKAKNKAFILACDSAVKYLIKEGIVPDAFVNIDAEKKLDFDDKTALNIPGFVALHSSITMMNGMTGKKIFYDAPVEYYESICQHFKVSYHIVETGGSVACDALGILRYLGCKNIALIGQDLAFTNNELYPGEDKNNFKEFVNRKYEEVEDVYGNVVYSDRIFSQYRRWFEDEIQYYKDSIHVIDATEGGAKIKGSTILTLEETIERYCNEEYEFDAIFKQVPVRFAGEEGKQYIQWILDSKKRLQRLRKEIKRAIDLCNRFILLVERESYDNKELKEIAKDLGKVVKQIEKIPERSIVMLFTANAEYIAMDRLEKKHDTEKQDQLIAVNKNLLLYKNMEYALEDVEAGFEQVYKKFEILKEENEKK